MPGPVHEMMVVILGEHPEWLEELLRCVGRGELPEGLTRIDSVVHLVDPAELRPDLLFGRGKKGYWLGVEIQIGKDLDKETRWPLLSAFLRDERGEMGDILVITAHRYVAEWALSLGVVQGPLGTRLGFAPAVLHLDDKDARLLLDPSRPELSFFAAWTMQERYGAEAQAVVQEALTLAGIHPDEVLRRALFRSILRVISDELAQTLREAVVNLDTMAETPNERMLREAFEQRFGGPIEARGEIRGEAKILLRVLAARKLQVDEAIRARILSCTDTATLELWSDRAAVANSIEEVFDNG